MSENRLSRDFQQRPIFDFCNNIGAKRTFGERATHKAKRVEYRRTGVWN
jgi:hypothetical protein